MRYVIALALFCALPGTAQTIDWSKTGEEGMHHFQSLVQIDSTGARGTETKVAEYVKKVLEAEGIPNARGEGPSPRQCDRAHQRQRFEEATAHHGP
jgi:hypothetical protein